MPEAQPPRSDSFGANAWLVDEMFEQFRADPQAVGESWREFFEGYRPGGANLARPVLVAHEGQELPMGPAGAAPATSGRRDA